MEGPRDLGGFVRAENGCTGRLVANEAIPSGAVRQPFRLKIWVQLSAIMQEDECGKSRNIERGKRPSGGTFQSCAYDRQRADYLETGRDVGAMMRKMMGSRWPYLSPGERKVSHIVRRPQPFPSFWRGSRLHVLEERGAIGLPLHTSSLPVVGPSMGQGFAETWQILPLGTMRANLQSVKRDHLRI